MAAIPAIIEKTMEREKFMTPEEAQQFGLIDDVIEKRPVIKAA